MTWLFLLAYTLSGLAGLIYEVGWTRLLTLYLGHTTAAASAVVAAFLGGLATGAGGGGRLAACLTPSRSLRVYIALELFVAGIALLLPHELSALTPLLKWSYHDGDPGWIFPAVRLLSCLLLVFVPATALGATFPMAIRWFTRRAADAARSTGALYAANTAGAAVGALLAGFLLIPAIGLSGTTRVGMVTSLLAAACVFIVLRIDRRQGEAGSSAGPQALVRARHEKPRKKGATVTTVIHAAPPPDLRWLAASVLGIAGFASLMHEIVWTRILALLLGPTIYAFAATLAAVISGIAIGSAIGAWWAGRTRRPAMWLASALAASALATSWTCSMAGGQIPRLVARQMALSPDVLDRLLQQGSLLTAALIFPTALCLGIAFPLALALAAGAPQSNADRFGRIYAINTLGAVTGSLIAGFVFIPRFGLQSTLRLASGCLVAAALLVIAVAWGRLTRTGRLASIAVSAIAIAVTLFSPAWDRELMASGAYLYAPYVPKDLDLETLLKAGTLQYYREGAAATVSVKRLTGTTTLAVDGKVDASNRSDMLTQKLLAHLPLLLHDHPRQVGIIGLGSGVTLGAALRHPIARADVIEISPEVVEASQFFAEDNHHALADPRTHLIIGDGRSHLLLSDRQYDVIISEPSNPWIAGVAALFTREFFTAARDRLAPGGVICQWAHTYNISDRDLRSIVATFTSVFPNGTLWLVGEDDVLLVASRDGAIDDRLADLASHWTRPGVADDLKEVAVFEPFSILSLFAGGPHELAQYGRDAALLTDDRMTLEFSGPRELHHSSAEDNGTALSALLGPDAGPAVIRNARASASAAEWRHRGAMMANSDVHAMAYDDDVRALTMDPGDAATLDALVREATLSGRAADALAWIKGLTADRAPTAAILIATSKLLAANGFGTDALATAAQAARLDPAQPAAVEQLASLYADEGDVAQLDTAVATLQRIAPDQGGTFYYAAVAALLHGHAEDAVQLATRAARADPAFAPVYDLLGAAHTKLGQLPQAHEAFLSSLRFDAHDSTAYTNLGLVELAAGHRDAAVRYFAEALGLAPNSSAARDGLRQARITER